jgi:hypothetical protein
VGISQSEDIPGTTIKQELTNKVEHTSMTYLDPTELVWSWQYHVGVAA